MNNPGALGDIVGLVCDSVFAFYIYLRLLLEQKAHTATLLAHKRQVCQLFSQLLSHLDTVVDNVVVLHSVSLGVGVVNKSFDSVWIDGVENVVEEHLVYSAALGYLPRKELGHSRELQCLHVLVLDS